MLVNKKKFYFFFFTTKNQNLISKMFKNYELS